MELRSYGVVDDCDLAIGSHGHMNRKMSNGI